MWKLISSVFRFAKKVLARLNICPRALSNQPHPISAVLQKPPSGISLAPALVAPVAHRLPVEILLHIISLAAETTDGDACVPEALDQFSTFPRAMAKPNFTLLSGISGSCRMYHVAVQRSWYRTLYIRGSDDWKMVAELRIARYVRELRVLSPALGTDTPSNVFMQFTALHTAFIDAHNDFEANHDPMMAASSNDGAPIGQYRLVAPRLPPSLRRLWVTNAHGPDISIIQMLRSFCPQLQELSISRCTLFSPRLRLSDAGDELCAFWARFPNDHDSYFACEGIYQYAISLSRELKPLQHLRSLHMGLYLTPHEAISTHVREHPRAKDEEGSPWCLPCDTYLQRFRQPTRDAEAVANAILFHELPQLQRISWASFFTANKQDEVGYDC
ncbi:hypothetical protein FRC12_017962 [Ceratobasidium sp. 428]|nr:hypothetical protein FRC12_017962 [Ceratobasidium sp. 428]